MNVLLGNQTRTWAMRAVTWGPARYQLKKRAHTVARARGRILSATGSLPEVANIFAASSPKAGSQWMRALFDHPIVRSHTGLLTMPQLDYRVRPERGLPRGTFVPGLYVSYDTYVRMPYRDSTRTIYMFRDPRELMVSGYYSATVSHVYTYTAEVEQVRDEIRSLPFDQGLLHLIEYSSDRLRDMATWVGVDDPSVAVFRLEEVAADPATHVRGMLKHCQVELNEIEFESLLAAVSRDALQAADLATRAPGAQSHYRQDAPPAEMLLKPMHIEAIERIAPGLIDAVGRGR